MPAEDWAAAAITPHLEDQDPASYYRILPPEYLVVNRLSDSDETARHAREAIRRSREGAARGEAARRSRDLASYDNALAFTFKYPLSQGNGRFNTAASNAGVLYASFHERTALAERAYRQVRLLREKGTARSTPSSMAGVTRIAFDVQRCRVADLTSPPFDTDPAWTATGSDYTAPQLFAQNARVAGAHGIIYTSVRDFQGGSNIALFDYQRLAQRAIDRRRVRDWFMTASTTAVDMQTSAGAHMRFSFGPDGAPIRPA
ncbi:RES family NAD+ phosphorylase [Salinisphaera sp. SWV1]|uniref:RES family NAD+ phosphorylase n=1 Tax=Salinisphaera sp. SWV1 TaxID=3454139 RepID=UPI003F843EE9